MSFCSSGASSPSHLGTMDKGDFFDSYTNLHKILKALKTQTPFSKAKIAISKIS